VGATLSILVMSCTSVATLPAALPPLRKLAFTQGCPQIGMSVMELQEMAKVNHMKVAAPIGDSMVLQPHHTGIALIIQISGDTVQEWRVKGVPTAAVAKYHPFWSVRQSAGFPERATRYVAEEERLPVERAYAVFRSCVVRGTTLPDIVAAWGPPPRRLTSINGDTTTLEYGYGVEGQRFDFVFFRDSLFKVGEAR